MTTVNLNSHCTIRLTAIGRRVWEDYWRGMRNAELQGQRVGPDGTLRLQLWWWAHVFGPHLLIGTHDLVVGGELEIEDD